jgi:hypothetical protein
MCTVVLILLDSNWCMKLTDLKRLENSKKARITVYKMYRIESCIMLLSTKVKTCREREMIMGCTVVHC